MREEMKAGDLVVYHVKDFHKCHGVGVVVRATPMYAFVKWAATLTVEPFIANKKHLELVSESR